AWGGPDRSNPLLPSQITAKPTTANLFVVMQERKHVVVRQLGAAAQEVKFHYESQTHHFRSQRDCQLSRGFRRSTRRQQVVYDDDALTLLYCVFVNLKRVGSIFQRVVVLRSGGR